MNGKENGDLAPKLTVRLSGTGGQGLVLMGRLLAEAASIHEGLNVVQTKSYGPEARGGASRSQVVMSPGVVDYLGSSSPDILICLSQQACDKYYPDLAHQGLLVLDATNVKVVPTNRAIEVPLTHMAIEHCGNSMCTNVLGLGLLCGYSNLVTHPALEAAVKHCVRPAFAEKNLQALACGFELGRKILAEDVAEERSRARDYGFLRAWNPDRPVRSAPALARG